MTGSFKGRGNHYMQLIKVLYFKLSTIPFIWTSWSSHELASVSVCGYWAWQILDFILTSACLVCGHNHTWGNSDGLSQYANYNCCVYEMHVKNPTLTFNTGWLGLWQSYLTTAPSSSWQWFPETPANIYIQGKPEAMLWLGTVFSV